MTFLFHDENREIRMFFSNRNFQNSKSCQKVN